MSAAHRTFPSRVAVIGGGPAGLMAAEVLSQGGVQVDLYDAMPSVGRKLLLAGKGGLNITHAEPYDAFLSRYRARRPQMAAMLDEFGPELLREWVHGLGISTFVGTSGRVFPAEMKAAPLLRAWLHRLRASGVRFHMRHHWRGWRGDGTVLFDTPEGELAATPDAVLLALGGGSWARLGSDAAWVEILEKSNVEIAPLQPANCGFDAAWSTHFRNRFAGHPLTTVALTLADGDGEKFSRSGQFVISENGVEGSLIYAASALIRDQISRTGNAVVYLDLAPGWSAQRVLDEVSRPRGARSMSSHLQSRVSIKGVKAGLLRELASAEDFADPVRLAGCIKALPLNLIAPRPIDEAISTAGGVKFEALDPAMMLKRRPGVFCAGEMLDWEAPTGGYLLTACFAGGRAAACGMLAWLDGQRGTR